MRIVIYVRSNFWVWVLHNSLSLSFTGARTQQRMSWVYAQIFQFPLIFFFAKTKRGQYRLWTYLSSSSDNKQLGDDRFDRMQSDEEEPSGILIGMDQANLIMENKAAIQSPCGLRAYKSPLGLIIGGPSQENPSKSSQKLIEQLITNSYQHAATSFTTTCSNSSRIYPKDLEVNSGTEADTSSLLNPAETGTSFSENADGAAKRKKRGLTKTNKEQLISISLCFGD